MDLLGLQRDMWGFPKIRGTRLGVLIMRIIIFGGLYWGPIILGNYHMRLRVSKAHTDDIGDVEVLYRDLWG